MNDYFIKDDGRGTRFIWFIKNSYSYIEPEGFWQHVKFIVKLPFATIKFYYYWLKDSYNEIR